MGADRYMEHRMLSTAWGAPAKAGRLTLGDVKTSMRRWLVALGVALRCGSRTPGI